MKTNYLFNTITISDADLDLLKKYAHLLDLSLEDTLSYIIKDYLSEVFLDD